MDGGSCRLLRAQRAVVVLKPFDQPMGVFASQINQVPTLASVLGALGPRLRAGTWQAKGLPLGQIILTTEERKENSIGSQRFTLEVFFGMEGEEK